MIITSVKVSAFGPFTGAAATTVDLAPGLTLVFGPNESGKSSLHAAVACAVTGRRRGRGAGTLAERAFRRRHEPWSGQGWAVGCVLELADGRQVELTHDLAGRVDCRAVDARTGADVSAEIMFEGSPDGSRYLGLNRTSFHAVAVVNQAELLKVIDAADGLQAELQRAATSASGERPAAGALAALAEFRAEQVGSDRARTKPLAVAREAQQVAQERLAGARAAHEEYLRLVAEAEAAAGAACEAGAAALDARGALEGVGALSEQVQELVRLRAERDRAADRARDAERDHARAQLEGQRAEDLQARFGGAEPPGLADGDQLAQQVGAALERWRHIREVPTLTGPSSEDLEGQLAALPGPPDGDVEEHPDVSRAAASLAAARRAAQQVVAVPDPGPWGAAEQAAQLLGPAGLRDLAARIEAAPDPAIVAAEEEQARGRLDLARQAQDQAALVGDQRHDELREAERCLRAAERVLAEARLGDSAAVTGPNVLMLAVGAGIALLGAALVSVRPAVGVGLLVVGVALATLALRRRPRPAPPDPTGAVAGAEDGLQAAQEQCDRARGEVDTAERLLRDAQHAVASAETRAAAAGRELARVEGVWTGLTEECRVHAVPLDGAALRALAAHLEQWQRRTGDHQRHLQALAVQQADVASAAAELASALDARGALPLESLDDRLRSYRRDCSARADQAREAGRRDGLRDSLEQRRVLEASVRQVIGDRDEALDALTRAAAAIGAAVPGGGAADRAAADGTGRPDPGLLTAALEDWNRDRAAELARGQTAQRDWATLQELLAGGTLEDLLAAVGTAAEALEARRAALESAAGAVLRVERSASEAAAVVGLDPGDVLGPQGVATVREALGRARAEVSRTTEAADKLRIEAAGAGERLRLQEGRLDPVADAEADAAAAAADLARLQRLDEVLEHTLRQLSHAQETVHRDIAPRLADAIAARLGTVTRGRYTRARIDPKDLQVQVAPAAGDFVAADMLSFGTTEQVYLLVRIALAEMLGDAAEPCPLLLDDVTVHADAARTAAILEALLALSAERQVILFSQELEVLRWAESRLSGADRHRLIRLEPVPTVP